MVLVSRRETFSASHRLYNPTLSDAQNAAIYDKYQAEYADRDVVQGVDIALVCVPTPSQHDGSADISAVREVCGWLDAEVICIRSTVPPGTTDALRAETGKRIVFSPEYIGEGPSGHFRRGAPGESPYTSRFLTVPKG